MRGDTPVKERLTPILALCSVLIVPAFAKAAGWVLIAPPRDANGQYIQNAPVSGSWTQVAAFDNAAQCEQQRMTEIETWERRYGKAEGKLKEWLFQTWKNEFLIRCMPYELWWKAQQPRQ
jgi:hypothetical protein